MPTAQGGAPIHVHEWKGTGVSPARILTTSTNPNIYAKLNPRPTKRCSRTSSSPTTSEQSGRLTVPSTPASTTCKKTGANIYAMLNPQPTKRSYDEMMVSPARLPNDNASARYQRENLFGQQQFHHDAIPVPSPRWRVDAFATTEWKWDTDHILYEQSKTRPTCPVSPCSTYNDLLTAFADSLFKAHEATAHMKSHLQTLTNVLRLQGAMQQARF